MPSTFFGLTIAYSGLQAANTSLNVAGHNISNINTDGYTKQQADKSAADAIRTYNRTGTLGSGVTVTKIRQLRDSYYDVKYRNNQAYYGQYSSKNNYMTQIEDYLNEFTLQGYTTEYNNFFKAVNQLTITPGDASSKNQLINNAKSMMDYFNTLSTNLKNVQVDANNEIKDAVEQINALAKNIAALNSQINQIETHSGDANDLRDKRNALVDELSAIVNISVDEKELGNNVTCYEIRINGQTLVSDRDYCQLNTVARKDERNASDADSLYDICWESGQKFDMYSSSLSGELKALIDIRDGNNGQIEKIKKNGNDTVKDCMGNTILESTAQTDNNIQYKGIPYYQSQINKYVQIFSDAVNQILTGKEYDSNKNQYVPKYKTCSSDGKYSGVDYPLFVAKVKDLPMSASNITVNTELLENPDKLATKEDKSVGEAAATVLERLNNLQKDVIFEGGSSSYYLESIVSDMSIDAKKSSSLASNYTNLKNTIHNQRLSVMGVDTDEEAMDLVKFQQAYNLNSKMLSVMNQIYDKLINQTGV